MVGDVEFFQIPTVWNVPEVGTRALGAQSIHLPLHELGMASSSDYCVVGGAEYEAQRQRHHGGGRQLSKLVKQISSVLALMGLESNIVQRVTAVSPLILFAKFLFIMAFVALMGFF